MRRRRDGTEVRAVGVRAGGAGVWATAIKGNAVRRAALKKEQITGSGCHTIGSGCHTIGCGCHTIGCGCRTIGCSCRTVGKRGGWGRNGIAAGMPFLRYRWSLWCAGDSTATRIHLYYILVSHGRAVYFIVEKGERPTVTLAPASDTRTVAAAATARPRLRYGKLFTKRSRRRPGNVELVVNQYFCANLFFLCSRVDWAATK